MSQAKILDSTLNKVNKKIDKVFSFTALEEVIITRIAGRRICKSCGADYHETHSPPVNNNVCDKCGSKLFQREDDYPDTIKVRLKVYKEQAEKLIDYYNKQGILVEVSCNGDKSEIQQIVLDKLQSMSGERKGIDCIVIVCKSDREIEIMRKAGRVVAGALSMTREIAKKDVTTEELNTKLEEYVLQKGGIPIFKGYRGYPKSICASINEEIVHGIPDERKLCDGDILSVDIGVEYNKYVADAAITIPIGAISKEAESLLHVCEEALNKAIEKTCCK